MTGVAKIYCLRDPNNGEIRYVGKTVQSLSQRFQQHIYPARTGRHNHAKAVWIREVLSTGALPEISLLEVVPRSQWRDAEKKWAEKLTKAGASITNEAPVGGGSDCSYTGLMTEEIVGLLGKLPDCVLAEKCGMTRKAIAHHRRARGIPPCGNRPDKRIAPPPMGGHNRISLPNEITDCLGKVPDYLLAKQLGVEKSTIARRRRKLGIPSYAEATGNDGRLKKGNYPARWKHK